MTSSHCRIPTIPYIPHEQNAFKLLSQMTKKGFKLYAVAKLYKMNFKKG